MHTIILFTIAIPFGMAAKDHKRLIFNTQFLLYLADNEFKKMCLEMKKWFTKSNVFLSFFMVFESFGNAGILLENYDRESILEVLHDEVPGLTVDSMTFFSEGWTNLVVDINNEWIFRFPREETFMPILERERLLLDRLRNHVSLPVPYYEFIGSNTAFVGYRKIPGEALHKNMYATFSEDVRQDIADTLALFLTQMHQTISPNEAFSLGYEECKIPVQWIESSLLGTLPSDDIKRIVSEALTYFKEHPHNEHFVLLHNDLNGENFAFDINTQKVRGVFDFSDAAVGHYSMEFGKLFCVHCDLARRTLDAYAHLNQVSNSIIPSAVDYILRRCWGILYSREIGNTAWEQRRIEMLEDFVVIWDELIRSQP